MINLNNSPSRGKCCARDLRRGWLYEAGHCIRAALAWRPVLTWRDEFWGMAVLAVVVGWVGLLGYVLMTIGGRS